MAFDLVTLFDYEAQLARDAALPPDTLRQRDAKIRGQVLVRLTDKRSGLIAWLKELKHSDGPWPGASLVRAFDAFTFIMFGVGVVSGLGTIQVLLRYDGTEPVNVIPFIAFYGVLQILLLMWYFLKSSVARAFRRLPGGALIAILRELAKRWLARHPQLFSVEKFEMRMRDLFVQRLRDVHKTLLLAKAWQAFQVFGLGYHLASLLSFILMISLNDYAFAWRTTLDLEPGRVHALVGYLAIPFAWASEILQPSLSLIESSQFNRFQRGFLYGRAGQTTGWWPFLAMLILVYGILPRFALWLWLKSFAHLYLKRYVPLDFQSEALWQRLNEAQTSWTATSVEALRPVPDQALAKIDQSSSKSAVLVAWRDVDLPVEDLNEFLKMRCSIHSRKRIEARGLSRDLEQIKEHLKESDVLVFASDPFELPGEAVDKIRQAVRERFPRLLILFAPLRKENGEIQFAGDLVAWQHALKIYRDPYLGLLESV